MDVVPFSCFSLLPWLAFPFPLGSPLFPVSFSSEGPVGDTAECRVFLRGSSGTERRLWILRVSAECRREERSLGRDAMTGKASACVGNALLLNDFLLPKRKRVKNPTAQYKQDHKKKTDHLGFRMRKVGQIQVPESRERFGALCGLEPRELLPPDPFCLAVGP